LVGSLVTIDFLSEFSLAASRSAWVDCPEPSNPSKAINNGRIGSVVNKVV